MLEPEVLELVSIRRRELKLSWNVATQSAGVRSVKTYLMLEDERPASILLCRASSFATEFVCVTL